MPSSAMMNGPTGTVPSDDGFARPAFPQLALVSPAGFGDCASRPRPDLPARKPVHLRLIRSD